VQAFLGIVVAVERDIDEAEALYRALLDAVRASASNASA
jgi:hypothetical protein